MLHELGILGTIEKISVLYYKKVLKRLLIAA